MKKPLLSILIPTKNRQEYIIEVLRNILSIDNSKFELIVQDNSDAPLLEDSIKIRNFNDDTRLKYFYESKLLSFVDNFSLGISNCNGEYLILIGDDDTVNTNIIEIVEWAKRNNIDAITPTFPAIYYWPGAGVNQKFDSGRFTLEDFTSKVKTYNAKDEVIKLLNDGAQNYLYYNLVKAYHGIVKTKYLYEIKEISGHIIGGLSPDIYMSIALSLLVEKTTVIDYPITISGICKKSGSADSATGRHTGELKDAPHFRGHTDYVWSKQVPAFYSVETIWGDSAIQAIKEIKPEYLQYFKPEVLTAYCIRHYPSFKKLILENLANSYQTNSNSFFFRYLLLKGYMKGPFRKLLKKVKMKLLYRKKINIFENIENINEASLLLSKKTEKMKTIFINNNTN